MSVAQVAVSRVHVFADRAWEQYLELNPLWATSQGDERWDDRLDDPGPEGRAAQLAMVEGWASDLQAFDGADLPTEDAVTLDLMRVVVTRVRQAHDLRLWEMEAIDQYGGPQGLIGDLARLQRADTPERLARLLARLAAYPSWMEAHRANVEAGLVSGRTAAAPVVERCITQTRRMLEAPAEQSPIVLAHASLDDATRDALVDAVDALRATGACRLAGHARAIRRPRQGRRRHLPPAGR